VPIALFLAGILAAGSVTAQGLSTADVGAALDSLQRQLLQVQGEATALQTRSLDLERQLERAIAAKSLAEQETRQLRDELVRTREALALAEGSRKEAEDARERAEAALAERAGDLLDLQADLAKAQREQEQLAGPAEDRQAIVREKLTDDGELARLESERKVLEGRYAYLEREIADLRALQRKLEEERQSQTRRQIEEIASLKRSIADKDREIASLNRRLPEPDGGAVATEEAARQAKTAAKALVLARRAAEGDRDPRLRRAAREAENRLHESQVLLSRTMNARGVYRVRPNDTLAAISRRYYSNSGQWGRIFQANRHVLVDPNLLLPGVSLVIP
jgi:nucleoid-associated protein YgaU